VTVRFAVPSKIAVSVLVLGASLTLIASACGSSGVSAQSSHGDGGPPDASKAGSPCVTAVECSVGEHCVYAVAGGCVAKGVCHDPPAYYGDVCISYCGCNGKRVDGCGEDGDGPGSENDNALAPVIGPWPCADAGSD